MNIVCKISYKCGRNFYLEFGEIKNTQTHLEDIFDAQISQSFGVKHDMAKK